MVHMVQDNFTEKFHQLTPKPRSVLILMLEGREDEEIAKEIGASEATVRKHIQNLCDHFQVPAEIAGIRKNRRQELIGMATKYLPDIAKDRMAALQKLQEQRNQMIPTPVAQPVQELSTEPEDWGGAPDVSVFYGRKEEIEKLKSWIIDDNCREIALLGMAGMGKTTLSVKLAEEIKDQFEYVVWRSLRNAPPLERLLADILQFVGRKSKPTLSAKVDDLITQLLEQFREARCLLILDNFDTILKSGDFVGHYQEGYKAYGQLLKRLGEEPHQSCLLLTSLEKPREIALLEGETLPVRSLQLEGLGQDAKEILIAKGLSAEERWGILIKLYRGNPLALKMVASTIQELFGGNVSDFLSMSLTGIVQDIIFLVEQQFRRLSPLEKEIMYWLALEEEPVTLTQLRSGLPVSELELFTALKSLGERSLIEKGLGKFSLQPAVKEYVRAELVNQLARELDQFSRSGELSDLKLLRNYPLEEDVNPEQVNPILNSLKERILSGKDSRFQNNIQFDELINKLSDKSEIEVGYALTNLRNLASKNS